MEEIKDPSFFIARRGKIFEEKPDFSDINVRNSILPIPYSGDVKHKELVLLCGDVVIFDFTGNRTATDSAYEELTTLNEDVDSIDVESVDPYDFTHPLQKIINPVTSPYRLRDSIILCNIDAVYRLTCNTQHDSEIRGKSYKQITNYAMICDDEGAFGHYMLGKLRNVEGFALNPSSNWSDFLSGGKAVRYLQKYDLIVPNKNEKSLIELFEAFEKSHRTNRRGGSDFFICQQLDYSLYSEGNGSLEDGSLEDGSLEDGSLEDGSLEDGSLEDGSFEYLFLYQIFTSLKCIRNRDDDEISTLSGGNMVLKVNVDFSEFFVDIVYTLTRVFKSVSFFNPISSHPALGTSYLICIDFHTLSRTKPVLRELKSILLKMEERKAPVISIYRKRDETFEKWIKNELKRKFDVMYQSLQIMKTVDYESEKPSPMYDLDESELLTIWDAPDFPRYEMMMWKQAAIDKKSEEEEEEKKKIKTSKDSYRGPFSFS